MEFNCSIITVSLLTLRPLVVLIANSTCLANRSRSSGDQELHSQFHVSEIQRHDLPRDRNSIDIESCHAEDLARSWLNSTHQPPSAYTNRAYSDDYTPGPKTITT